MAHEGGLTIGAWGRDPLKAEGEGDGARGAHLCVGHVEQLARAAAADAEAARGGGRI